MKRKKSKNIKGSQAPSHSHGELQALATELSRLSRFMLLSSVTVQQFLEANQALPKKLRAMTLGELTQRCCDGRTLEGLRLSASSAKVLVSLFSKLCQDGSESSFEHHHNGEPTVELDELEIPDPTLSLDKESLGPTELVLQGLIDALRVSPGLGERGNMRLGEFWEAGWPRAPFEESFTLSQVSRLESYTLLKKHSVTDRKAHFIYLAVKKALNACAGIEPQVAQAGSVLPDPDVVIPEEESVVSTPTGREDAGESLFGGMICGTALWKQPSSEEARAFALSLQQEFSPLELEFLLCSYRYLHSELAILFQLDEGFCQARTEALASRLRDVCLRTSERIQLLFGAFEFTPLLLLSKIEGLVFPGVSVVLARMYTRLVLVAFGYRELRYRRSSVPDVVVQRGGALELGLEAVAEGLEDESSLEKSFALLDREAVNLLQKLIKEASSRDKSSLH